MTYREAIQKLQKRLEAVYDEAGYLRDQAAPGEKQSWNDLRTHTRAAAGDLEFLDNSLTNGRAVVQLPRPIKAEDL